MCPLIDVINDETFEYAAGTPCLLFCNISFDFQELLILLVEHKQPSVIVQSTCTSTGVHIQVDTNTILGSCRR